MFDEKAVVIVWQQHRFNLSKGKRFLPSWSLGPGQVSIAKLNVECHHLFKVLSKDWTRFSFLSSG